MSTGGAKTPKQTSPQAQTEANINLARAQTQFDRPTQITPLGTSQWTGTPEQGVQTITLSPEMQQQLSGTQNIVNSLLQQYQGQLPGQLPAGTFDPSNYNFDAATHSAQQAAYQQGAQYLDPQFKQGQAELSQNLADRGIPIGSEAYNLAMDEFARNKQAAYSDLQNRSYLQGLQAQNQGFTQGLQGRQQLAAEQQIPLSALAQLTALEQGSQYQPVPFMSPQISPIQYNAAVPQQQGASPWWGLGGAFLGAAGTGLGIAAGSERHTKTDIEPLNESIAGVPLYHFRYINDQNGVQRLGCMFDEVERLVPEAAFKVGGRGYVNYSKLCEIAGLPQEFALSFVKA